jgi:hypothetical protein
LPLGGNKLSFSGKEVKKDEDHHQLAGENRHHRTTRDATDGCSRRWHLAKGGSYCTWTLPFCGDVHTLKTLALNVALLSLLGGNSLNPSGKEVKKDEDHHQLAGENRHHRTTDAANGYASRIIEEDKKGGVFTCGHCPC